MKVVNINDVLKILHKYGEFLFVTDHLRYMEMRNEIANLPNVTPQPKMGKWIKNEWGNISCSFCGCTALYDKVYPGESVFGKAIQVKSTFCPTCGAKMQEVEG